MLLCVSVCLCVVFKPSDVQAVYVLVSVLRVWTYLCVDYVRCPVAGRETLATDVSVQHPNSRRLRPCHLIVHVWVQTCIPSLFMSLQLHKHCSCSVFIQFTCWICGLPPATCPSCSQFMKWNHLFHPTEGPCSSCWLKAFRSSELHRIKMKPKRSTAGLSGGC